MEPHVHGGTVNMHSGRRALRWVLVALFVSLCWMGVPAVLSLGRPNRERDDVAAVLVVGEDLARIPG